MHSQEVENEDTFYKIGVETKIQNRFGECVEQMGRDGQVQQNKIENDEADGQQDSGDASQISTPVVNVGKGEMIDGLIPTLEVNVVKEEIIDGLIPTIAANDDKVDSTNLDKKKSEKLRCFDCFRHSKIKSRCGIAIIIILAIVATLLLSSVINTIQFHLLLSRQMNQWNSKEYMQGFSQVQAKTPLDGSGDCSAGQLSLSELTSGWVNFDPPTFLYEFPYNTLEEVVLDFSKIVPLTLKAKYIQLNVYQRSDNEPWAEYWTRIRVINGDKQYVRNLFNCNYQTGSLTSYGQNIILPVEETTEVRIKSTLINKRGKMFMKIFIQGYKT